MRFKHYAACLLENSCVEVYETEKVLSLVMECMEGAYVSPMKGPRRVFTAGGELYDRVLTGQTTAQAALATWHMLQAAWRQLRRSPSMPLSSYGRWKASESLERVKNAFGLWENSLESSTCSTF